MPGDLSKGLIPTEDELKAIVAQLIEAAPMQIPVVLLQVQFARLMRKFIDRLGNELDESIRKLEDQINR